MRSAAGPRQGAEGRTGAGPDGYDVPDMATPLPIDALRRSSLFAAMNPESLESIARTMKIRKFRRGEVLFHEGDPGDSLFIVVTGSVKVVVPSDEGEEAILATLAGGDSLGELSLLDGAPRSASAIAVEAVDAFSLPRQTFLSLVATDGAMRDALLAQLATELRRLTTHVADLHFLDLTGRLAARLVRIAEEDGLKAEDGSYRLEARITQGDLASMIGATRQSVNKLLGEFAESGLLRLEPDAIVIPDLKRLLDRARR